jgi:hypothetical protein
MRITRKSLSLTNKMRMKRKKRKSLWSSDLSREESRLKRSRLVPRQRVQESRARIFLAQNSPKEDTRQRKKMKMILMRVTMIKRMKRRNLLEERRRI